MHSVHEYSELVQKVLAQAEKMIDSVPKEYAAEPVEVLGFVKRFGCQGTPVNQVGSVDIGSWLAHPGQPVRQHDAVTIVPCFSDDVPPAAPQYQTQFVPPGMCFKTDQMIILYNVDHWSLPELALTLLHEGRHARHWIGPVLAGLQPLEQTQIHETSTYLFTLNILVAWGGEVWNRAVEREVAWLKDQGLAAPAGKIVFAKSSYYWPELDRLLGPTKHPHVLRSRQSLVALQANMLYWPERVKGLSFEEVCHSIVAASYS